MDKLKFGVLVSGLAGVIGCFVPLAPGMGTLWGLHRIDMMQTLLMIGTYAVPFLIAAAATARPPFLRVHALVSIVSFAAALWRLRHDLSGFLQHGGVGAKLMAIAPLAGILFAVAAMVWAPKSPR